MPDLVDGGNSHNFQANASLSERKCLLQDDKVCKKEYREVPPEGSFSIGQNGNSESMQKSRGEKHE